MSSPASATETQPGLSELVTAGSLEISPRELHRAAEVGAILPAGTCGYIPSLPRLPLTRTPDAIAAIPAPRPDPVPPVAGARRRGPDEVRDFLVKAAAQHGVHRVLLIGGDEPRPKGPYADSLQVLEQGVLKECGVREFGVGGYPEGHPRISLNTLDKALQRKLAL